MRMRAVMAALTLAVVTVVLNPLTASAGGLFRTPAGVDPYAYRYEPRGYYPYYNSGYWRPAHEVRKRRKYLPQPPYYQAWGDNRPHYNHRQWHRKNHGRIRKSHF